MVVSKECRMMCSKYLNKVTDRKKYLGYDSKVWGNRSWEYKNNNIIAFTLSNML